MHPKVRRPVELTSLYDDLAKTARAPRTEVRSLEVGPAEGLRFWTPQVFTAFARGYSSEGAVAPPSTTAVEVRPPQRTETNLTFQFSAPD